MISTSFWPSANGTTSPILASGIAKRAASAATRKSQCRASSHPPAYAAPCTIAIVGWREASISRNRLITSASGSSPSSCRRLISVRSRPEQKAVPAPRITTARTLVSRSSASKRRPSASIIAVLSALRRSGRLSVIVAIESATVYRISSAMDVPSGLAEERARDHHTVDLGRPLADASHARLAVPALERELFRHTVAAVDLHRRVDHAPEHLARVELGDRGLDPRVLAAVGLPGAVPDDPAARPQLDLGVGEHPLDGLALRERRAERRALLGVGDGHAMRGDGHAQIARGVREAVLHEQIEGEIEPLALGADEVLGRDLAVLQGDVVRDRRGPDHLDRLRGEAGRASLEDEARDPTTALRLVGTRPDQTPRRVVGARGEDLAAVQDPAVAALLGARLDRAGRVGAAGRLGDGEERLEAVADGRHRVFLDLLRVAGPDRGGRIAAEDAAARIVEAHPVLRHLLERDAHRERVEAAAAVFLGGAQRPEARGLGLGRDPLVILLWKLGRVGVDPLLDGNDLVAYDPTNLLAQGGELVGQREPGKVGRD